MFRVSSRKKIQGGKIRGTLYVQNLLIFIMSILLTHMTTMDSFIVRGHAKFQGGYQAKQLNLTIVPVMLDSTTFGLEELKEDPKTSTWFKDCTGVFKGIKNTQQDSSLSNIQGDESFNSFG